MHVFLLKFLGVNLIITALLILSLLHTIISFTCTERCSNMMSMDRGVCQEELEVLFMTKELPTLTQNSDSSTALPQK